MGSLFQVYDEKLYRMVKLLEAKEKETVKSINKKEKKQPSTNK